MSNSICHTNMRVTGRSQILRKITIDQFTEPVTWA